MVSAKVVAVPALATLSAVLQGCGGGSSDSSKPDWLKSCSGSTPEGGALNALEKMRWGYRVNGDSALLYSATKPLFAFCPADVASTKKPETKMTFSSSTSVTETSDKLSTEVGVSGGFGAFSAAASFSYSQTSRSKLKSTRIDRTIKSKLYHVAVTSHNFYDKLTDETKDFMKTATPADIVDSLGEFYATEATFGGLLKSTSVIEMTEDDTSSSIETQAAGNFGVGGVKVGFDTKKANFKSNAHEFVTVTVLGGNQSWWLGVSNHSQVAAAQEGWGNSVQGDDMYAIESKLKPIWEVLKGQDDAKAKQIEDYLKKKWTDEGKNATEYGEGFVPEDKTACPAKFNTRQVKNYPGVKAAEFFCKVSAPTCLTEWNICQGFGATSDHWSADCDGTESSCWTGNKAVCMKITECCEGYELSNTNTCMKKGSIDTSMNASSILV